LGPAGVQPTGIGLQVEGRVFGARRGGAGRALGKSFLKKPPGRKTFHFGGFRPLFEFFIQQSWYEFCLFDGPLAVSCSH